MKVTLESTTKIVKVNGVFARVWEGHTETGIPVHAFVTRIAAPADADQTQFALELVEHREPTPEVAAIPYRLVL